MTALSTEEQNAGESSREEVKALIEEALPGAARVLESLGWETYAARVLTAADRLAHWRKEYLAASLGEQTALASLSALRGEVGKVLGPFVEAACRVSPTAPSEAQMDELHAAASVAASLLSTLEGNISSRTSPSAHVSCETATDDLRSGGCGVGADEGLIELAEKWAHIQVAEDPYCDDPSATLYGRLAARIRELQETAAAFCAPWAATYARDFGLPAGHLHAVHYDILARCGARLVDFKRHDPAESGDAVAVGPSPTCAGKETLDTPKPSPTKGSPDAE